MAEDMNEPQKLKHKSYSHSTAKNFDMLNYKKKIETVRQLREAQSCISYQGYEGPTKPIVCEIKDFARGKKIKPLHRVKPTPSQNLQHKTYKLPVVEKLDPVEQKKIEDEKMASIPMNKLLRQINPEIQNARRILHRSHQLSLNPAIQIEKFRQQEVEKARSTQRGFKSLNNNLPWDNLFNYEKIGLKVGKDIPGLGDRMQFTSLPENFYMAKGYKLIDTEKSWIFDHNPYVLRDTAPDFTLDIWGMPHHREILKSRRIGAFTSNAERHSSIFGITDLCLSRPRLYKFEDFPFHERKNILFHTTGKTQHTLPQHVIDHVLEKYGCEDFYQIGSEKDPPIVGVKRIITPTFWDLAEVISSAKMCICVDSGPSWVAAAYPDVILKRIRVTFYEGSRRKEQFIPLEIVNDDSHWDCTTCFKTYNCTEKSIGFTESYRKI